MTEYTRTDPSDSPRDSSTGHPYAGDFPSSSLSDSHLSQPLTILHINASGISDKLVEISLLASQTQAHIISIQESKCSSLHPPRIRNYISYSLPACSNENYVHHGLILYVHNSVYHFPNPIPNQPVHGEAISITLLPSDGPKTTILSLYNRPKQTLDRDFIKQFIRKHPRTIIIGDLNARHIDWDDHKTNALGKQLLDLTDQLNLFVTTTDTVTRPGRRHVGSFIDLVVTPRSVHPLISSYHTLEDVGSDHLPTLLKVRLSPRTQTSPPRVPRPNFDQADWPNYQKILDDRDLPYLDATESSVDAAIVALSEAISEASAAAIPTRETKQYNNPLPREILLLIKQKKRAHRDFHKYRLDHYKTHYNYLNKLIKNKIVDFRHGHYRRIWENQTARKPKDLFSLARKFVSTKKSHKPIAHSYLVDGDQRHFDVHDKLTVFYNLYKNIHAPPPSQSNDEGDPQSTLDQLAGGPAVTEIAEFSCEVSPSDILDALKHNKQTAPGRDGIYYPHVKHLSPSSLEYLSDILETCLRIQYFPRLWKLGTTVLLPKPLKNHTDPNNYRPITLLPALGKVLEKIINIRLSKFAESHNLLPNSQSGFRKARSIQDNLLEITQDAAWQISHSNTTLAVFFDVYKAFDKVWHEGLLHKMFTSLKLSLPLIKLVRSFLHDRYTNLSIDQLLSPPIRILAGTPQGSILSPLLFNLYVSDAPQPPAKHRTRLKLSQFADDHAAWANYRCPIAALELLQVYTNSLLRWCDSWRIRMNPAKTQVILFFRQTFNSAATPSLTVNDHRIFPSKTIIYLGLCLDSRFNLRSYHTLLSKRVKSRLYQFRRITGSPAHPRAPTAIALMIYKMMIRPLLDFVSTVMVLRTPDQIKQIEKLQINALRLAFHAPKYISSKFLLRKALKYNITPIHDRVQTLAYNYCHDPRRPKDFTAFFDNHRAPALRFRRSSRKKAKRHAYQRECPVGLIKEIALDSE